MDQIRWYQKATRISLEVSVLAVLVLSSATIASRFLGHWELAVHLVIAATIALLVWFTLYAMTITLVFLEVFKTQRKPPRMWVNIVWLAYIATVVSAVARIMYLLR
jgi:hypothetical protein